ncbi:MAG: Zn-ribbon domain-containing OB-fold protein [Dehalococcoidia bacterium]
MNEYDKPLPVVTELNRAHWDGADAHEFRVQRCSDCGHMQFPPIRNCTECLSETLEWVAARGTGSVYSFIVYHQGWLPGFLKQTPYNLAIVELDEGVRVITNILDIENEDIQVGMPVEAVYEEVQPGVTIPRFRPATASTTSTT